MPQPYGMIYLKNKSRNIDNNTGKTEKPINYNLKSIKKNMEIILSIIIIKIRRKIKRVNQSIWKKNKL